MRAIVMYESMFGNTEQVAQAVAKGLTAGLDVEVHEVGTGVALPDDLALLVVGGPTHAFGMSRASTRRSAVQYAKGSLVSKGDGIREWLAALPANRRAVAAAAFDTHADKPRWLYGSASRAATRRLRRRGYRLASPPTSFYVTGMTGPLAEGELDRAQTWGAQLAASVRRALPAVGGNAPL